MGVTHIHCRKRREKATTAVLRHWETACRMMLERERERSREIQIERDFRFR